MVQVRSTGAERAIREPDYQSSDLDFVQIALALDKGLETGDDCRTSVLVRPTPVRQRLHLNELQIAAIVAGYDEGMTLKELGAEFGIHRTTVSGVLEKSWRT